MKNNLENKIDHILLSLRSDDLSALMIRSVVMLAEKLNADLCGLFVEDSDLLHVADLPFSREIIFPTANVRKLDSAVVLRHMRSHAENLRQMMIDYAKISNVTCSFRTREGSIIESTISESTEAQLIILLPDKYSSPGSVKGDNLEKIINPAVMFFDDSPQAKKSLHVIRSLLESGELHQLKVLTTDSQLASSARHYLQMSSSRIDFVHIDNYSVEAIVAMFSANKPGLMILPLEDGLASQGKDIKYLLDKLSCILLLVR